MLYHKCSSSFGAMTHKVWIIKSWAFSSPFQVKTVFIPGKDILCLLHCVDFGADNADAMMGWTAGIFAQVKAVKTCAVIVCTWLQHEKVSLSYISPWYKYKNNTFV